MTTQSTSRDAASQFNLVHTEKAGGINTIYVLNKADGGYAILTADDNAPAVIGYSDEGAIDETNIPRPCRGCLKVTHQP